MRITVLGKSPSWPDAGGACSGYLVQVAGYALLLDCGSGVFARLREVLDYFTLDAVLLTHLHSDHFFDLVPFSYALLNSPRRPEVQPRPLLHAPPHAGEVLRATVGAWSEPELVPTAFDLREYDPAAPLTLGPLAAHFCEVPHYTTTYAVRLSHGKASLTFSADCGPNHELVQFAAGTDLLLIEGTQEEPEELDGPRGHLTAREAGDHGRQAGARRVVITHFTDEYDLDRLRAEAGAGYGGPVDLAETGAVYTI